MAPTNGSKCETGRAGVSNVVPPTSPWHQPPQALNSLASTTCVDAVRRGFALKIPYRRSSTAETLLPSADQPPLSGWIRQV